jgi:uncharacterized membrane protein
MTATVATPNGNQFGVLLAIFLIVAFTTCVVLWVHERRWDQHDAELRQHAQQLATLAGRIQSLADFLEVEINDAVDDSPEALQVYGGLAEVDKADVDTEEFPAAPATVPDGMPLAVQSALIEARPSPVPRDLTAEFPAPESDSTKAKRAAWVDEQMAKFNYTGGRR